MNSAFLNSISPRALASLPQKTPHMMQELAKAGATSKLLSHPNLALLLDASIGNSGFIETLVRQNPRFFLMLLETGPEKAFDNVFEDINAQPWDSAEDALMKALRQARQKVALITAMADISGYWSDDIVTSHLSRFADAAIQLTCNHLLLSAHQRGMIRLKNPKKPLHASGLVVLAMGKLGASELNYSSDIDLIILFEPNKIGYQGRHSEQHFFTRLAQDFTRILQERTKDGYVFRVDLRLRPDPRSTPLAVNLHSAISYYETVGQNWERAAMIKARVVAADNASAELFEQSIQRYVWRKYLDFAAITDIHSIKRQVSTKAGEALSFAGHNVKLGLGGIREIEFFIQTQQLIWGGRTPDLRASSTVEALQALQKSGHIDAATATQLTESYWYLRRVEHYLQMLDDAQTHTLPENDEGLARIATFLGYKDVEEFRKVHTHHCHAVHSVYSQSVESERPLSVEGNLVFTGVEPDPETLKTLTRLGFRQAESVSDLIQSWHRGTRRATKSLHARQVLTELVPELLLAISHTNRPDDAFLRFDEFIEKLPAGVQIFSLLSANPELLKLLTTILGSAPAIGEMLARNPSLLDIVLESGFYEDLPDEFVLEDELISHILHMQDYEDFLRMLRQFKHEKQFQAGVQLLKGSISTTQAATFLSRLADVLIRYSCKVTMREFERKHGVLAEGALAVIAMGKLGSQEMSFSSDLDLVFIYHAESPNGYSDGDKPLSTSVYYQRLISRLTQAFTLLTKEGELYELDLRLRPGGAQAPLATSLQRFEDYYSQDAWEVETLALSRARVVFSSDTAMQARIEQHCLHTLSNAAPAISLAPALYSLRQKISQQHPATDPWQVKFVSGGMLDIDLMAQFIRVTHANRYQQQLAWRSDAIFEHAHLMGILSSKEAVELILSYRLQRRVWHVLRLCSVKQTIDAYSSSSLKQLVCTLMKRDDCESLRQELIHMQEYTKDAFERLVST